MMQHKPPSDPAAGKTVRPPNVLLLTLVFAPDGVSTAMLLSQLARELLLFGHRLSVLTTTPHYNQDLELRAEQQLQPLWKPILFKSQYHGIPVYHAKIGVKGKKIMGRLLDYMIFHLISTWTGLFMRDKFDVVWAPSPPLTIGVSAALLAAVRRIPFIYNVQEIYPEIAVTLGLLKNRTLISLLERVERFVYARAEAVVVISEKFRQRLLARGVPAGKLHVISNFIDVDWITPGDRHNQFSTRQGLNERFVVLYAGNIGLTQDLETIISASHQLHDLPTVCFLIVGDGARREWLQQQIADLNLGNVRLLPYQPRSHVPQLYASSDACLVALRRGTGTGTFPSKIYTIMAAGRAAIVCADQDAELSWVVQKAQCGLTLPPEEPEALADGVRKLYQNRELLREMGANGRRYVVRYHSPQHIARQYHELISAVAQRSR